MTDARAVRSQQRVAQDDAFERFAGSAFAVEHIVRALAVSPVRDLRPVGSTSVVFRADLNAPFRAALKLATHGRPLGPTAEVAAYRLARCLGLTTVPPAVLRHISKTTLQRALDPRFAGRWPELVSHLVIDPQQRVEAAAIFWVEGLGELPIASAEGREPVFQALLQGTVVTPRLQLMAAQLSDLSVFDWLIGNGDRWSGANVQGDTRGQWLYIRDHDLAFSRRLRPEVEARLLAQLGRVERFSRKLIERVRTLSAERFERQWARDEQLAHRAGWLREQLFAGVLDRRAKLLTHLQHLIDRYGEEAVLAFP